MTIAVGFNPRFRRPPGARRGATLEIIGETKGSLIPNLANDLAVKKVTFVVLNCVPIQKCTVFVFKGAASMMLALRADISFDSRNERLAYREGRTAILPAKAAIFGKFQASLRDAAPLSDAIRGLKPTATVGRRSATPRRRLRFTGRTDFRPLIMSKQPLISKCLITPFSTVESRSLNKT